MPIPLVRRDGKWLFDTAAGKDEIVSRRIGEDELTAIGVCRTYWPPSANMPPRTATAAACSSTP